jgi:hypothetical protein
MQHRKTLALAGLTLLALTGCAAPAADSPEPTEPTETAVPHGYVEGASEAQEPQLHLAEIAADGSARLRDLLTEEVVELDPIADVQSLSTDGRYLFADTGNGVDIVDSGFWTVDHADHMHYYRADSRTVGAVEGTGPAVVRPGTVITAVSFPDEQRVTLVDTAALGDGEVVVIDELEGVTGEVASLGEVLLVADGSTVRARFGGETLAEEACTEPSGTVTTRVGTAIGCVEGAVLATHPTGQPADAELAVIPYPADAAPRALEFDNRKGRPTAAGVAGDAGVWLLDTRESEWRLLATERALTAVSAADDSDEHVVGIDVDGRMVVLDGATGEQVAATEPIEASSLTLDAQRAYVAAPGVVHEIDYADGARIARSFESDAALVAEVGR